MEWFSNWFNSTYYHLLYKSRDFVEAENFINNLIDKYKFPKHNLFLDLACGKGRHSIFLNKKGYKSEFLSKQEKGLFDGKGSSKEGYDIQFAKEREKKRLLDLYIGDNNGRNLLKTKLQIRKSNIDSNLKDEIKRITCKDGVVITFGWNSNGIGKTRGFEIVEILLVAHGGNHNDTICVVERKL